MNDDAILDNALAAQVAALLMPIVGPTPAGRNVRYEGDYDRIGEARRDENANLPRGIWVRNVKQADWAQVEQLCADTLAGRSKDLRIAGWLCEAWVHRYGFAGLTHGVMLIDGLCRDYWEPLYPPIDGDASARIAAIEWLNQRLPIALRQVVIAIDPAQPDTRFTWSNQLDAQRLEAVRLRDAAAAARSEASGAVTLARFGACLDRTPTEQLALTAGDLEAALAQLSVLDATLDSHCGREAPGLGKIREVAREIFDFAKAVVASRSAASESARTVAKRSGRDMPVERLETLPSGPVATNPTPALSRDSAFAQLEAIAQFLGETEPHSPIPYVIKCLIEWSKMPLPVLEAELRNRGSSMSILLESIGMEFDHDAYDAERQA